MKISEGETIPPKMSFWRIYERCTMRSYGSIFCGKVPYKKVSWVDHVEGKVKKGGYTRSCTRVCFIPIKFKGFLHKGCGMNLTHLEYTPPLS